MSFTKHKIFVFFVLVAYLILGLLSDTKTPPYERYPFFSWQLFSSIPNEKDDYSVEVYRIGEMYYDPPLQFTDMKQLFRDLYTSPTAFLPHVRKLADAVEQGDRENVLVHKQKVEAIFQGRPFSYALLKVHIDQVEYYKTGRYEHAEVLEVFTNENSE